MRRSRCIVQGLCLLTLLSAAGVSCDFGEGPSLQVDVRNTALAPTTGDAGLCCCRVVGEVENLSTVPVHVTVLFRAYGRNDNGEVEIGAAVDFLKALQSGEKRPLDASGLLTPCSNIHRFELVDVDVRGVWFPP